MALSPPPADDKPTNDDNNNNAPQGTPQQPKRKPSRRANTAERRATHNAVERQRRETLNGRFLDLAALLPNLSQIRRPSKSSIVNSSIAHIHASRRHRMLASRELRALKLESDALRREINEWRDRAGLPRMDEPPRNDSFAMILSGELEAIPVPNGGMDEEDDDDPLVVPYDPVQEEDVQHQQQQQPSYPVHHHIQIPMMHSDEMIMLKNNSNPFAHSVPPSYPPYQQQWDSQMVAAQRTLFTPPATSHGLPTSASSSSNAPSPASLHGTSPSPPLSASPSSSISHSHAHALGLSVNTRIPPSSSPNTAASSAIVSPRERSSSVSSPAYELAHGSTSGYTVPRFGYAPQHHPHPYSMGGMGMGMSVAHMNQMQQMVAGGGGANGAMMMMM